MFNRQNRIQNMDAYVEERLSEYLDGTLSAHEREIVEAYVATNERARASLESLRYTVNLLKQTPAPALPRQFTLPVTARAPAQGAPAWMVWSLRGVAVAATAAFVVLLGVTLFRPGGNFDAANSPSAMQAQPSVVIALAPTATPQLLPAQAPANDNANTTNPIPITVEPAPATAQVAPITLTPPAVGKAIVPTSQLQDTVPPSAPTQAPNPSTNSELAQPTAQPTVNAADASAAGAAETQPVTATATNEAQTQRTMSLNVVEGVVTANQLRVRRGPGVQYRALGGLRRNDRVQVVGRDKTDNWLAIEYPLNTETGIGWIGAAFVQLNAPLDTLPILDAPASETPVRTLTPTLTLTPAAAPTLTPDVTTEAEGSGNGEITPEPIPTPEPSATPTVETILQPTAEATVQSELPNAAVSPTPTE